MVGNSQSRTCRCASLTRCQTLLRNRCLVANALEVSELMVECVAMATSYAQRHPNVECAYGVLHLLSRGQLYGDGTIEGVKVC